MFRRPWSETHTNGGGAAKPYVIAVCHQKGGVAKTTTVLSLGACLVENFVEAVLLIDLDPQGNLTTGLGLEPKQMACSSADSLLRKESLLKVSRETRMSGLDIVPANPEMLTISRQLYQQPGFEFLLRDRLAQDSASFYYDMVVIDCPPSLGSLTISALTAADLMIVPFQCEYFAIQALENVFKMVNVVRTKTNPQLQYRLLATMFDRRGNLHANVFARLQERQANALFETVIGFDSKLRESQMVGLPINLHAPKTRAAENYRTLAQEVFLHVSRRNLQAA